MTSSSSATFSLPGAPPQSEIEHLLPGYIARQRWFGGKSRPIRAAEITSSTSLPGTDAILTTVAVHYEDGGPTDLYQLPLALATGDAAEDLESRTPRAVLTSLRSSGSPAISTVLYDASFDPTFRSALLHRIASPAKAPAFPDAPHGSTSDLAGGHSSTFDPEPLLQASSRVGSAEQSNTSLIYGDRAILKLFRRLRPGENPDVEIAHFLTETAHFPHIPAYLGDLHLASDRTTLGFLQQFAPNQGDGWDWTIRELGRFYESVATAPATSPASASMPATTTFPGFTTTTDVPPNLQAHAGGYLQAAALLGQRTGEMHLALATPTGNRAFAAEPYTAGDLDADRLRIGNQADTALATLAAKLSSGNIDPHASALAHDLLARQDAIRSRATDLTGDPGLFGKRIRLHGDYHLGQLLRSGDDFLIVDFEGEPAKTLEERRRKQTPLKDVAGMLRSFSYAARSALGKHTQKAENAQTAQSNQDSALSSWAALWESSVCSAYLRGYREATDPAGGLLPAPAQADALLSALLLEKALYELLYELNNRPTWLHIPLAGLLALARQ